MLWVILVFSVGGVAVFLRKLLDLHRAQIRWPDFLKGIFNILKRRNIVEAVSICEDTPGPVASIVRAAILHHDQDAGAVLKAVQDAGLAEISRMERSLGVLAKLAQVVPLLGLLGTVLGMMNVLLAIQQNAPLVHAGTLMGGLWRALICTAAALMVSIPAYAAYNLLVARVESIVQDMERAATEIVAFITGPGCAPAK